MDSIQLEHERGRIKNFPDEKYHMVRGTLDVVGVKFLSALSSTTTENSSTQTNRKMAFKT
ncbi:hypothetical protein H5410_040207 [Solanum commersonii]|uniref:Uncharacterized protein n=1 Tax=Solanum commersonii TaxID=4109 RepID=A0A9J5XPF5_SOLCO|nr:hypothetical protein H5410_040205 [Solanum commersonii]KAG5589693.1 hypothetical protein H5410_040207 [Solanum commersonii]